MNDQPENDGRLPSNAITSAEPQGMVERFDATPLPDLMEELAKLIGQPARAPAMGVDAAAKIAKCFDIVADDVEAIAEDRVRAVLELQQEAKTYATVLRQAGKVLSDRIEAESARAYKLSLVLRETRAMIATDVQAVPASESGG